MNVVDRCHHDSFGEEIAIITRPFPPVSERGLSGTLLYRQTLQKWTLILFENLLESHRMRLLDGREKPVDSDHSGCGSHSKKMTRPQMLLIHGKRIGTGEQSLASGTRKLAPSRRHLFQIASATRGTGRPKWTMIQRAAMMCSGMPTTTRRTFIGSFNMTHGPLRAIRGAS